MFKHPVYIGGGPVYVGDQVRTVAGPFEDGPVSAYLGTVVEVGRDDTVRLLLTDPSSAVAEHRMVSAGNLQLLESFTGRPQSRWTDFWTSVVAYGFIGLACLLSLAIAVTALVWLGRYVFGG